MVTEQHIRESNLIEGIDDPKEDARSMAAWQWLDSKDKISQPVLLELHGMITKAQLPPSQAGAYRQVTVYVGNYQAPAPTIASGQIYGWITEMLENWINLDPKEMHIRFEKIHPFIDGNGRTGRMLMWWHEVKLGREPTLIRSNEADRHYYYQWFRGDTDET